MPDVQQDSGQTAAGSSVRYADIEMNAWTNVLTASDDIDLTNGWSGYLATATYGGLVVACTDGDS